jgi:F0F1-type ATP synthase delta subunit
MVQNLQRFAKTLKDANDETGSVSDFDQFLSEFHSVWSNNLENCSDKTQQKLSKRRKTTNSTYVDGLDDEYSIEYIKEKYLPLLKRDLG